MLRASRMKIYNMRATSVNTLYKHQKLRQKPSAVSPKTRHKANPREEEHEETSQIASNHPDVVAPVLAGDGDSNNSDIDMNDHAPDDDSDDMDGLADLDDNFDDDVLGIGETGAVGESGDLPPRAPSPTPSSAPSIESYVDDMDDVWERDKLEADRIIAEEEAERQELLAMETSHEEDSEDEDREEELPSVAGSDDDEEIRRSSSELSPAPESYAESNSDSGSDSDDSDAGEEEGDRRTPDEPRGLDSYSDSDSDSEEEEGLGTTLEHEPWFPEDPKYARGYNNQMREWEHQKKMGDDKETNEEALAYIKTKVLSKFAKPDGTIGGTPNRGTAQLIDQPNSLILPFAKSSANARPLPNVDDPASLRKATEDSMETPVMIRGTGLFQSFTPDQVQGFLLDGYAEARRLGIDGPFVPANDEDALKEAWENAWQERENDDKAANAERNPFSEVRRKKAQKHADAFAAKEEAALREVASTSQPKKSTAPNAKKSATTTGSQDEDGDPVAQGVRRSTRRVSAKTAVPAAPKSAPKPNSALKGQKKVQETPVVGSERVEREAVKANLRLRDQSSADVAKDDSAQPGVSQEESGPKPARRRGQSVSAEDKWAASAAGANGNTETADDAVIAAVVQESLMELDEEDAEEPSAEDVDEDEVDDDDLEETTPSVDESKKKVVKKLQPKWVPGPLRFMYPEWDLENCAEFCLVETILFLILYYDQDGKPSGVTYPAAHLDKIDFNDETAIDALNEWRALVISSIKSNSPATMPGIPYVFPNTTQSPGTHKKCVLVYEADDNRKAELNEVRPAVFFIIFYDQNGDIQVVVYSILMLGKVLLSDPNSVRKSNKWRSQWIYRKAVSRRFGRNNDDEWSLKESDWLIRFVACILYAHRHELNVFERIIWEAVEVAFDAYFKRKENYQIRMNGGPPLPLAQTFLDAASWKPFLPGVQFDRRQQLPSDRIGGIMTMDQLRERATALLNHEVSRYIVTATDLAQEANWGRFVRSLLPNPNWPRPNPKLNERLDGVGEIFEYIKRDKYKKSRLAKKRGSKEDNDNVGKEDPNAGTKTTTTKRAASKKTASKPKPNPSPKKCKQPAKSAAKKDDEDGDFVKPKQTRKRKASSTSPQQSAKRQTTARAPTLQTIPEEDEPADYNDGAVATINMQARQAERAVAKEGGLQLSSAPASAATSGDNSTLNTPGASARSSAPRTLLPRPTPDENASPKKPVRRSPRKSPPQKDGKKDGEM